MGVENPWSWSQGSHEVFNASVVNPCLWKASAVMHSQFCVVTSSDSCKCILADRELLNLFHFLTLFEGINMRLTWSQNRDILSNVLKRRLGPIWWHSVPDSVVLFHAANGDFFKQILCQLCGNLPETHVTWVLDLTGLGSSRVRPIHAKRAVLRNSLTFKKCPSSGLCDHRENDTFLCLHNWELDNWKLT